MKKLQKLTYCMGLAALAAPHAQAATPPSEKPNIIFILCDDMGYGDLGCYGQPFIQTPCIDQMAREGMRFTQAYAGSPECAPSRASLMTGQHSGHGHVRGNKEYWSGEVWYGQNKEYAVTGQEPYDPQHIILPEIMKKNGYTTGMFGKWAGGYEGSTSTPDKRGVDEYFGYMCQFQAHLYYPNFLNSYSRAAGDTAVTRIILEDNIRYPMSGDDYFKRTQYSADIIHRKALEWLDKQDASQPFYGFFTYTLPHAELAQPNDSLLKKYKQKFFEDKTWGGQAGSRYNASDHTHAQFAGMINRLDTYVGEILAKLKEKGLDENTIVIFSSDNGPHEEGGAAPTFFGRDGKLRGLKRQLDVLCRHAAVKLVKGEQMSFRGSEKRLEEFLGRPPILHEKLGKASRPGIVTGLAWTQAGGEILFIETMFTKGSGKLQITGQLGDVMKESAQIAVTLVKNRYPESEELFRENDLHIHVPAGATPKDGPSAGITLVTALSSLVTGKQVRPELGRTGEVSLRGDVMPIGGLPEKLMAAQPAGEKSVLIPVDNKKDLEDIAEEVKQKLEIIPVATIEETLNLALEDPEV